MDLEAWKDDVMENCKARDEWISKRTQIQKNMKTYLGEFFSWDRIDFDYDLNIITLKYESNHDPVIRVDKIKELTMDFIVTYGHSDELGGGVWIELYPFGLPSSD